MFALLLPEEGPLEDWRGSMAILAAGASSGREAALLKLGDRLWSTSGNVCPPSLYRTTTPDLMTDAEFL